MDGTRNPYDEEYLAQLAALRPEPMPAATYVAPTPASPAPVPDRELEAAAEQRNQADAAGMLLDAAGYFNRAGGGSAPVNAGDAIRSTRNDAYTDLVRKRAMAGEQAKLADAERGRKLEAALNDPASPESQQAWDLVGRSTLGQRVPMLADAKGKLPGRYAPGAHDLITGDVDLLKAQDRAAVEDARAAAVQRRFEEAQATQGRRFDQVQASQSERAAANRNQAADLRFRDRGVGGFEFDPKNPPSESQAREFSQQVAAADTVRSGLHDIRKEFEQHGPELFRVGPAFERTKTILADVRVRAKEAYKLGVLNGDDFAILSSIISDPNTAKAGAVPAGFLAGLDAAEQRLNDAVAKAAYRFKYRPVGDTLRNPPAADGKIKVSNGTETLVIDAADEADAAKDGYTRAP